MLSMVMLDPYRTARNKGPIPTHMTAFAPAKLTVVALLLGLLTACGGGGGGGGGSASGSGTSTSPPPAPDPPMDSSASDLADDLDGLPFAEAMDLAAWAISMRDPEQVVGAGLADSFGLETVTLTDISLAYRQVTYDMWQVVRDYLDELDRASLATDEQLSYDIYSWQTDTTLAQRDFLHFEFQGSYFITSETSQDQTFFTELQPLATEQDARDYLTRLAMVDDSTLR